MTLPSDIILRAINKSLFAAGNDELRPVMSGVFCELNSDNLTFVATDAHKLVRYRRLDAKSENSTSFIIPSKPLNLLKNCLGSNPETTIEYNQNNAFFTVGEIHLVCRLVDGKYRNYDAVIPKENPNKLFIEIDDEDLSSVILFLKTNNKCKFKQLIDITAIDYPNREKRFKVVYLLLSHEKNLRIIKSYFYSIAHFLKIQNSIKK